MTGPPQPNLSVLLGGWGGAGREGSKRERKRKWELKKIKFGWLRYCNVLIYSQCNEVCKRINGRSDSQYPTGVSSVAARLLIYEIHLT